MEDIRIIVVMTFCCLITLDPVILEMTSSNFTEENNNVTIKVSHNEAHNTKAQTVQSSTPISLTTVQTKDASLIAGTQENLSKATKIYTKATKMSSTKPLNVNQSPSVSASPLTSSANTNNAIQDKNSTYSSTLSTSTVPSTPTMQTIKLTSATTESTQPYSTFNTTEFINSSPISGREMQSTEKTQLLTEVITPPPTATVQPRKSTSKQPTRTTETTIFSVSLTTGGIFQTINKKAFHSSSQSETTLSKIKNQTLTTSNKTNVHATNSQISSSTGTSGETQPMLTENLTDNHYIVTTSTVSSSKKEGNATTPASLTTITTSPTRSNLHSTTATKNASGLKNITDDTTTRESTKAILSSQTTPTSKHYISSITSSSNITTPSGTGQTSTKTPTTIQTTATGLSKTITGSLQHATTKETENVPLITIPSTLSGSSSSTSNTTLTSQLNVISTNAPPVSTVGTETTDLSNQTTIFGKSTLYTTHSDTGKSNLTTQESGQTSVSVDTTKVPTTSKLQSTSIEPPQSSTTTSLSLDISTLQSASGTEKQQSSQQTTSKTTIKIKSSNEITIPPPSTTSIENGLNNSSNGITTYEPSPTITSMERSNLTSTNDIPTQPPLTTISTETRNLTSASDITTQALLLTTSVDTNILNSTTQPPLQLQTTPVDNLNSTSEITMQSSPTKTSVETRNLNFTSGITTQSSPQTTSPEIKNLNSTSGITTQSPSSKTSVEKYNLNSASGITTHSPPPTTSVITTYHTSVSGITKQSLPPTTSVETSTFKPENLSTEQPSSSTITSMKTSHQKSTYGITTLPPLSTSQPSSTETTLFTTITQLLKTVTKKRTLTPTVKSTTHPSTTQLLSTESSYIKTSKVSSTNELTTQPPTISMKTNKYNSTNVTTKQSPSSASTVITTSNTKAVKLSTTTTVGPCRNPFSVIQGGCRKPCDEDDVSCGSSGKCYIDDDKLTICVCNTDDGLFQHSGDKCDVREMKSKYVITIAAGGAGGIILIVLFIVCGCWCWRRTRDRSYASEWDSLHDYRVSGRNVQYIDGYKTDGTFGKGKDNPAYDKYYREGDFTENDKKSDVWKPRSLRLKPDTS
ncbi:mucin-3A-like isoform X2 [Mytilus californianus]|uniref:mucin-3A-like isoform X2 n=1 Tax=Mytilus californianus TaxID=6549 RepID=UPI002247DB01|nr:mucin-3A-like isoform X2 [Mytilus californianus]